MNIEIDDNTGISAVIIAAFICLTIACLGGCHMSEQTNQKAIEAGLVQKTQPTQSAAYWSKP